MFIHFCWDSQRGYLLTERPKCEFNLIFISAGTCYNLLQTSITIMGYPQTHVLRSTELSEYCGMSCKRDTGQVVGHNKFREWKIDHICKLSKTYNLFGKWGIIFVSKCTVLVQFDNNLRQHGDKQKVLFSDKTYRLKKLYVR